MLKHANFLTTTTIAHQKWLSFLLTARCSSLYSLDKHSYANFVFISVDLFFRIKWAHLRYNFQRTLPFESHRLCWCDAKSVYILKYLTNPSENCIGRMPKLIARRQFFGVLSAPISSIFGLWCENILQYLKKIATKMNRVNVIWTCAQSFCWPHPHT